MGRIGSQALYPNRHLLSIIQRKHVLDGQYSDMFGAGVLPEFSTPTGSSSNSACLGLQSGGKGYFWGKLTASLGETV
jgi:hypothetical protein